MTISNSEDATQRELTRALDVVGEQTRELLRRGRRIEDLEHEVETLKHDAENATQRIHHLETLRSILHAESAK